MLLSLQGLTTVTHFTKYKVLLFAYKGLHSQAPEYITDLLLPRNCSRTLRFSNSMMLSVLRSRLKLKGDRAFSIAAPRL